MLSSEEELHTKIHDFLRRKEAKYPGLTNPTKRERIGRDPFKRRTPHDRRWTWGMYGTR